MLSMFKFSAKLVQLFLNIGFEESRFFSLAFRHPCLVPKTYGAPPQEKLQEMKVSSKMSAKGCLFSSSFALPLGTVVYSWAK